MSKTIKVAAIKYDGKKIDVMSHAKIKTNKPKTKAIEQNKAR